MLSIIIPVYNVEKYLRQCLDSILNQSFKDYEVIIVNDGTKDHSQDIIDEYCLKDSRFKSYIKENGGLSSARNYGLQYVKGDYLTFLDSDDYLELDIYEHMMNEIIDHDFDIVLANLQYFFEESSNTFVLKGLNQNFNIDVNKQALLSPMFAWNKIYKTSYFKKINKLYPVGLWYEDIPVTTSLFAHTNNIGFVDKVGYYYRQRGSSIMGQVSDKFFDIFEIMEMVMNYYKENNLFDYFYNELEYLAIEQIMLYGQFRFLKSPRLKELYELSIKFMDKYFKNYRNNPYIKQLNFKNKMFIKTYNRLTINLYKIYLRKK